jgi:hypothetical protein
VEDNKGFLPPKELTESRGVTEEKDGKTWHSSAEWYKFVDPVERLKGYGIMKYLRVVPPEEMAAREEEQKKKMEEREARRKEKLAIDEKDSFCNFYLITPLIDSNATIRIWKICRDV